VVHGRRCNPHRSTTTLANLEITSLWRHWWRHNSETITDIEKWRPPCPMKSSELWKPHRSTTFAKPEITSFMTSQFGFKTEIAKKMTRENFSIGTFNITKNRDNPIKTVRRDSFFSHKTPKNSSFLGVTQPQGSHSSYILGDTTRPRHITHVQVWSKSDQRRLRKTLHKQTDRETER